MKEAWHKWSGYVTALTPKYVFTTMSSLTSPTEPELLIRFRRNKFKREDKSWLTVGAYLTMTVGRNGNGKVMRTLALRKRVWTKREREKIWERAQIYAKEVTDIFGSDECGTEK